MTQPELIIEYVKLNGSITPAKLNDKDRSLKGYWIGSEASRVCRSLRTKGVFASHKIGKFEKFYFAGQNPESYTALQFLKEFPSKPKVVGGLF